MRKKLIGFFRFGITAILNVCALTMMGSVQAQSITDGSTPSGIAPGSPAGSYALSDFDNVNLFNGHLDVRLNLLKVAGRGGAGMTVGVSLNPEPWVVKGTGVTHDWWSLKPGYGPGVMQVRRIGVPFSGVGQTCSQDSLFHYRWTRTAVTFKASDGTEFELWDKLSGGPWKDAGSNFCSTGFSRGTEFVTADGTSATFVSDSVITDRNRFFTNIEPILFPTGTLLLKNGTRYRIVNGLVESITDRNGNLMTFTYGLNSSDPVTYRKVLSITDPIKRVVSFQYLANTDVISFKGFNGAARTLTLNRNSLSNALRADFVSQGVKKPSELFPGITPVVNEQVYNPSVIASITLPNGRSYVVRYNQYAEVARVVLPTGGAIEYDMVPGSGLVSDDSSGQVVNQIHRRVWKRRAYTNETDTLPVQLMIYSASGPFGDVEVTVDQLDPQNGDQLLRREKHYFHGNPVDSLFRSPPFEPGWAEGREYRTEYFSVSNGVVGNVLRKVENLWEHGVVIAPGGRLCKARIKETTVSLMDSNQVSKTVVGYDDTAPFNNQNNVKEYDFGAGAPGALLRETRTTYVNSTNYTASNVNLVSLVSQVSVFDGNGIERARSSIEYDNYTLDGPNCQQSNHCPLGPRSNISGFDPGFGTSYNTRGNVTASTQFLLTNGSVTGSISSYSHYDIAGNVVSVIDARSTPANIIATTIEYDDRFGAANGEARSNSAPAELAGQSAFAFPSRTVNPLGHESYTQRDYYLGQAVDVEDANGMVSSGYFNDLLDRPTQVISAANGGGSVKSQTTFAYDDVFRLITTTSDRDTYGDNILKSQLVYDGLGRTIETRQYEDGSNYLAVQTQYDALGRGHKVSNPFRPWQSEAAVWTTTVFDALGRAISITTPDSAVVKTAYFGNRVLVADQNSSDPLRRKRISMTDGLGRLKEVWEITAADSATESVTFPGYADVVAGYVTRYEYDTLDSLLSVSQRAGASGTNQVRSFEYDSLKRLKSAVNPESGTIAYQYDDNGNLLVKTDARGVSGHYAYDAINRITRRWYNASSSTSATTHNSPALPSGVGATDEVKFYYDTQALPAGAPSYARGSALGRLVAQTYGTGSHGDYYAYDVLGRSTLKFQQLGAINYQLSAAYNLSGALSALVYPSGRTITNTFDQAGRLTGFSGNLGDGVTRSYATEIIYSAQGGLVKEKFGTATPLYNKLFYNSRGQLAETRVSTSYTGPTDTTWNRGAIINHYSEQCWGACSPTSSMTDNNGNLRKQEVYIPNDDQVSGYVRRWQQYDYDALNRLNWVREMNDANVEQWKQQFTYDRWGNRTINTGATYGLGINNKAFTVNTANNRLGVPGGQPGVMSYDAAGNLTNDTYTGAGNRTYDAENKITSAWGGDNQAQLYRYDGAGQRIKRTVNGVETWQVYGFGGELIAEYAANASAASPQKEYGYRNGQLLVTAEPASAVATNVALAANGATATASSTLSNPPWSYLPSSVNNGDHRGLNPGNNSNSHSSTATFPQWVEVAFNGSKTIDRIDVFSLQDNYESPVEPTEATTFSLYGLTAFEVQYWNGSAWVTVPGGSVTGNNKVWKKITFAPLATTKIRVQISATSDGFSRIVEVEAWTPGAPPPNVALASNGATVTASSTLSNPPWSYLPSAVNNGDHRGLSAGNNSNWHSSTATFPQWVEVAFNGSQTIDRIDVFSLQDNYENPIEPTESTTFSLYGLTAFEVQYWNNGVWTTVPGGSVTGNNKVWKKITFAPLTTTKIRVQISATSDGFSRIVEVEAWAASPGANINWLVSDHLGTPRMILDQTGTLANVKRHDYLPFGEELFAPTSGRSAAQGYANVDGVRQQFTQKERDVETGLDYFLARYYSSIQGRFTSPDEFTGGPDELYFFATDASANPTFYADLTNPQSLNKYHYGYNNPLRYVDPDGHDPCCQDEEKVQRIAAGAAVGAGVGAVVGGVAGGARGAIAGGAGGTLVLPGVGTVAGAIFGGGAGGAGGATQGALIGAVVGGTAVALWDYFTSDNSNNDSQPAPATQPQSQPEAQPAPPPQTPDTNKDKQAKSKSKSSNTKKERSVEGATDQLKGIQRAQSRARAGQRKPLDSIKKSEQNLDNELKKIKSSKDIDP